MAKVIRLVQGDTRPTLICTLTDSNNANQVIDITGATLLLKFREMDTTEVVSTLTGTIVNGPGGQARFDWLPDSLQGEGDFEGEVEITFADGRVQTVFDLLYFVVREQF